ncbi:MAG: hypothetical protein IPK83_22950 [Planctomycetes bacterium]|nr:hypothetical protein [Planctomycetota bacterium]
MSATSEFLMQTAGNLFFGTFLTGIGYGWFDTKANDKKNECEQQQKAWIRVLRLIGPFIIGLTIIAAILFYFER